MIAAKLSAVRSDNDTCVACGKMVYLAEKREVDINNKKEIYHRNCFRCSECHIQLELTTYGSINRVIYCHPHLKLHKEDVLDKSKYKETVTPVTGSVSFIDVAKEEVKKGQKSETSEAVAARMKNLVKDSPNHCGVCTKTVYAAESMEVEIKGQKKGFHKACFKCSVCGLSLTLRNFGSIDSVLYCKTHLIANQPTMAKENSYFISPLKANDENYKSIGLLDTNVKDEYDSDSDVVNVSHNKEKSEGTQKTENESTEKELAKQVENLKVDTPATVVTETVSTTVTIEPVTPVVSATSTDDDEYEKERKARELEREERRRKREEERRLQEEEDERKAAKKKRRREREERRKRLEEEAQKDNEEIERRAEERKKRLEGAQN